MDSPLQKDQDKPAWCRRYRLSSLWQSSGGGIFFRAWLRRRDRRAFSTVVVFKRTSIFSPIKAFFVLFEFSIRAKKIYQAHKNPTTSFSSLKFIYSHPFLVEENCITIYL